MGRKGFQAPAPQYDRLDSYWDTDDDYPGPRCAHTLTAIAPNENHGARLILFGGATDVEGQGGGASIRLAGLTNDVHLYDVESNKWTRLNPSGEAPSPRAAHAAAAVGTMVVFQGGAGPSAQPIDDLYALDITKDKCKWHRIVVQGQGPGPRYGHVMELVAQRYLVCISGNDGRRLLSDVWALDTAKKPYVWQKLNPEGNSPSARMYATGSARWDGMLLLCGGRDTSGTPLADAYGLILHTNGQWEWTRAPGVSPSPRYQHAAVFVGGRLHVIGGANKGGRGVDGEAVTAVLDTTAGVWLDRKGLVRSSCISKHQTTEQDTSFLRRCRHAAASVGANIYIYGGLRGDTLFSDFLLAENEPPQSNTISPALSSQRASSTTSQRIDQYSSTPATNDRSERPSSNGSSMNQNSMKKLTSAASDVLEAVQSESGTHQEASGPYDKIQTAETPSYGSDTAAGVCLHNRAVVVAKETVGRLGGMVRQLSLDQFENESRRMTPLHTDLFQPAKKFTRQKSSQGSHKKIISTLLKPRNWRPPANRSFFLDVLEVSELCHDAEQIFKREPTVLHLKTPIKVFGDLHGQFGDLMRLFDEYGFPSTAGDISYIDYLFLGDFVDRGQHSLETITLLLALKASFYLNDSSFL
ncbi:Serine/threonine-protein phosphatase [Heracleum sosnowskyi]|uniref:Serine/threonine-protein phosphatase n=1 Tax=Heracleum sosnowskyi TaxID=360622 RepID=A0AAD8GVE7_9APIA|nr:Serine/threonine-protein phosphatase [Heracleum sosnowskyi]